MNAGDASTLRQVSLAAVLGLDARLLLSTDDAATHLVYDKVIDQALDMSLHRADVDRHNQAVEIIEQLITAWNKGRKKG